MRAPVHGIVGCAILLLGGLCWPTDRAEAQTGRPLFHHQAGLEGDAADRALMRFIELPTTRRAGVAHINRLAFDADRVELNLFPDLSLEATTTDLGFSGAQHRAWFGNLAENQGSAVFIINGDRINGKVNATVGTFEIFPLENGDCIVVEHYLDQFPECGTGNPETSPRARTPESRDASPAVENGDAFSDDASSLMVPSSGVETLADSPVTNRVRVIVAYTANARNLALSVLGRTMLEHIDLAIAESNQGYANSGVQMRIELACLYQTDFLETYAIEDDVEDFRNDGDGKGDEVHQLRADFDADMCSLITDGRDRAWCGYSYGMDYTSRENMFQATAYSCVTSNFTFAHEFGHTQGCRHDSDTETIPFPYGHGFRKDSNWRTIMALSGYTTAPRLNYWSNPDIISPVYPFTAMGTPVDGDAFANDCRTALNTGDDTVINHEATPLSSTAPTDDAFADDEYADKVVIDTLSVGSFSADAGSFVQFRAGSCIVLGSGFHARAGCELRARLASPMGDPVPESSPASDYPMPDAVSLTTAAAEP